MKSKWKKAFYDDIFLSIMIIMIDWSVILKT